MVFFFSIPPGHEGVPAFSDDTLAGHRKPSSRDEYLAGAISRHQRAQCTPHLLPALSLSATGLSFSADDPEFWDFTLDGIEELDVPAGAPSTRGLRPGTPGNHQMQTRSKTPQRAPGRPTDEASSYSRGQDQSRFQHPFQYQARTGEVSGEESLIC